MQKLLSDILAILKAPFVGELDMIHLFLVVGFILVAAFAWLLVLNHVRLAAEAA